MSDTFGMEPWQVMMVNGYNNSSVLGRIVRYETQRAEDYKEMDDD